MRYSVQILVFVRVFTGRVTKIGTVCSEKCRVIRKTTGVTGGICVFATLNHCAGSQKSFDFNVFPQW